MFDQEQLQNFLHVFELGSLSEAQKRAHVTQPALSRQIRLLEERIGAELFDRTGRGMTPTDMAERLAARARPLLKQMEGLAQEFSDAPVSGRVTLCVSPSIGMSFTADVIEAFRLAYPLVQMRVVVLLSGAMGEALRAGTVDVGLLHSPAADEGLVTQDLWCEAVDLICPKNHPLTRRRHISLKRALQEPLLLPSSQHGIVALVNRAAAELGVPVKKAMEVDSVQLGLKLVERGLGHLLLTSRVLADAPRSGLRSVRVCRPTLARTAQVATTEGALGRRVVRALFEQMTNPG